jgi:CheY-like chemotaxis protein
MAPSPQPVLANLLVVDANLAGLGSAVSELKSLGYAITIVADPSLALTVMRCQKPDFVLMAVRFPPDVASGGNVAWDGFSALSWWRRFEIWRDVPVVLMNESEAPGYRERALASGAVDLVLKPLDTEHLHQLIQSSLDNLSPCLSPGTSANARRGGALT